MLAASDAAIVAAIADGTVMVLRAGTTQEEEAQLSLDRLQAVGARVIGAVVNDRDSTLKSYGGYYPSKYYGAES